MEKSALKNFFFENDALSRLMNTKLGDEFATGYGKIFLKNKQFRKEVSEALSVQLKNERAAKDTDQEIEEIRKSIEFSPEYYQAGMAILSYFGSIIRKKYSDVSIRVKIEQENLVVRLIIETPEGKKEEIEKTLVEYGLVICGKMEPEQFYSDPIDIIELKQQLRLAYFQIENQREMLKFKDDKYHENIHALENDVTWLRSHIGKLLTLSSDNTKTMNSQISDLIELLEDKDEIIISSLSLIAAKIDIGVKKSDEDEIKKALQLIKTKNPNLFTKVTQSINDLIIKGAISGTAGNFLYEWIKTIF